MSETGATPFLLHRRGEDFAPQIYFLQELRAGLTMGDQARRPNWPAGCLRCPFRLRSSGQVRVRPVGGFGLPQWRAPAGPVPATGFRKDLIIFPKVLRRPADMAVARPWLSPFQGRASAPGEVGCHLRDGLFSSPVGCPAGILRTSIVRIMLCPRKP